MDPELNLAEIIRACVLTFYTGVLDYQDLDLLNSLTNGGWFRCANNAGDGLVKELTIDDAKEGLRRLFTAFPDLKFTLCDYFQVDCEVMVRWQAAGTHLGPLGDLEPTGQPLHYDGVDVFQMTHSGSIVLMQTTHNLDLMLARLKARQR
jgi:predicted ester cyclase